jgi:oligopeptidase B
MKPDLTPSLTVPRPPIAAERPSTVEVHGVSLVDPYSWLKAENWKEVLKDPAALPLDIREHLQAENSYTSSMLTGTEDLRTRLVAEMRGRIKEDDSSVPQPDGPYEYYTRYRQGGQHPLVCR